MARHTTVSTETTTHHVTLEHTEDNGIVAACHGSPTIIARGSTEQEAISKIKNKLTVEYESPA
jgi:predicted RNase H-like HicB family nuclease